MRHASDDELLKCKPLVRFIKACQRMNLSEKQAIELSQLVLAVRDAGIVLPKPRKLKE